MIDVERARRPAYRPHVDARHPERLPRALLAYAIALAVFLLIPPTIHASVGPPAAFTGQELFDLFTPVAVLPLAWLVLGAAGIADPKTTLAFVAIGGLWAGAQGIHLAANAIGDAFAAGPTRDAFYATDAGALDHFLDEDLGHWAWHAAWALLSLLFLVRGRRFAAWPASGTGAILAGRATLAGAATVGAGILHGATFAVVSTEGGTAALGIPLSVVLLVGSARSITSRTSHPLIRFLAASSITTLLLYAVWAAINGGRLVEPCSVIGC